MPCGALIPKTIGLAIAFATGVVVLVTVITMLARKRKSLIESLTPFWIATKPETKLKILCGFCALRPPRNPHHGYLA